jgi:hypothetical protein
MEEGSIIVKRIVTTALISVLIAVMVLPAHASLVPMSWGFPTLSQNSSLSELEQEFSTASDLESSSISFPETTTGALATSFPTILQTSDQDNMLARLSSISQVQSASFAYPWLSIGLSPVASMGLL